MLMKVSCEPITAELSLNLRPGVGLLALVVYRHTVVMMLNYKYYLI